MREQLEHVSSHMRGLGLGALSHANWHATHMHFENPYWSELSVLQAVHACEILIKARIAQEHPLLIFETLPKPEGLSVEQLIEKGRTYQYSDLPARLFYATGIKIPAIETYKKAGTARNSIQHFVGKTGENYSKIALELIYEVIDPFINDCWQIHAIEYIQEYDEMEDVIDSLVRHGIIFTLPLNIGHILNHIDLDRLAWPSQEYRSVISSIIKNSSK